MYDTLILHFNLRNNMLKYKIKKKKLKTSYIKKVS